MDRIYASAEYQDLAKRVAQAAFKGKEASLPASIGRVDAHCQIIKVGVEILERDVNEELAKQGEEFAVLKATNAKLGSINRLLTSRLEAIEDRLASLELRGV